MDGLTPSSLTAEGGAPDGEAAEGRRGKGSLKALVREAVYLRSVLVSAVVVV